MTPILHPLSSILRPPYAPGFARSRPRILPLPKGEGWGEGKETARRLHAADLAPRPRFALRPSDFGLRISFGFRLSAFGFLALLHPAPLLACATCFGQSDAPMAQGMTWGIVSLLAVVAMVLATLVLFFIYLGRRAANLNRGRASVLASPDFLGLPQRLDLAGRPFLPTRPEPLLKSTRVVP